ncbi:Intraflagellar transport protein 57 like [Schistosoma japonicum]|nr:Intraflagellar transport protein 57 like [Schistosoma japonicum]
MTFETMSQEKSKSSDNNEEQNNQYAVFVQMESLNEKLKLLNYEKKFCKRRHQKPIPRHYFAIPTNPGEQFHCFTSLAAWLISQANCKIDQPQEYDDPNATISTILDAVRTLGYTIEFPPLKLKSGCGEYCINVLNMLADASLQVQDIKLLPPEYPEDETEEADVQNDESSQTDEETTELTETSVGSRFKYSLSDGNKLRTFEEQGDDDDDDEVIDLKGLSIKSAQTHKTDLIEKQIGIQSTGKVDEKRPDSHGVLECSTDPADWKLEVERILPQLRINVRNDVKDWRTHLEQIRKLKIEMENTFEDAKSQLVRLQNDLTSDADKISNREKYINNQVEPMLAQYRTVQDNLSDITAKYRQASGGITTRSHTLAEISGELERVKTEMDEKGSSMTDSSSVVRIKQAIQRLKSEITTMDIRTGVLEHILLRTHLRMSEDSQKPLFSKVMEPSDGNGSFVF